MDKMSFVFCLVAFLCFFETGSPYVNEAGFKFIEICLLINKYFLNSIIIIVTSIFLT